MRRLCWHFLLGQSKATAQPHTRLHSAHAMGPYQATDLELQHKFLTLGMRQSRLSLGHVDDLGPQLLAHAVQPFQDAELCPWAQGRQLTAGSKNL